MVLAAGVGGGAAGLECADDFLGAGEVDVFEGVGWDGGDFEVVCDVVGVFADGFAVAAVGLVVVKLVGEKGQGECVEFCVGPVERIVDGIPVFDFGEKCLERIAGSVVGSHGRH